ncbi:hypothetical protein GCM10010171_57530 [Actinokineospora fastidiosa]|uniref:Uncharacterized protein n=1 Tax=Actinokineospora fastidiosa TaxID=1816 RepID=A0A918GQW8_9PSEU|nr:hypothetical protein GCM10010171_57530 [Actinokineospora fastidiosa]
MEESVAVLSNRHGFAPVGRDLVTGQAQHRVAEVRTARAASPSQWPRTRPAQGTAPGSGNLRAFGYDLPTVRDMSPE